MRGQYRSGQKFALDPKMEWNAVASLALHEAGVQWTDAMGVKLRALRDSGNSPKDAVDAVVKELRETN